MGWFRRIGGGDFLGDFAIKYCQRLALANTSDDKLIQAVERGNPPEIDLAWKDLDHKASKRQLIRARFKRV